MTQQYEVRQTRQVRQPRNVNDDIRRRLQQYEADKRAKDIAATASQALINPTAQAALIAARKQSAQAELDKVALEPEEKAGVLSRIFSFLDVGGKHVARPAMGVGLNYLYRALPGEQKGEQALREAVGLNPLSAFSNAQEVRDALEEADLPWYTSLPLEILLDPLTYIPVGGAIKATKAIKRGEPVGKALKEAVPSIGLRKTARGIADVPEETLLARHVEIPDIVNLEVDDAGQFADANRLRKVATHLAKVPVVKQAIGIINPEVLVQNEGGRAVLGHAMLLENGRNHAAIGVSGLRSRYHNLPFTVDSDGRIKDAAFENWRIGKKGLPLSDLLQRTSATSTKPANRQLRAALNDQQRTFVDEIHALLDDARKMMDEAKVDYNEIDFTDVDKAFDQVYMPRIALGKKAFQDARGNLDNVPIRSGGSKSVGSKATFQKSRYWDTMDEALDTTNYLEDPIAVVQLHLEGVYRVIADKKLADFIKKSPDVKTITELAAKKLGKGDADNLNKITSDNALRSRQGKKVTQAIRDAIKDKYIAGPTLAMVKRFDENLGRRLQEAQLSVQTVETTAKLTPTQKAVLARGEKARESAINKPIAGIADFAPETNLGTSKVLFRYGSKPAQIRVLRQILEDATKASTEADTAMRSWRGTVNQTKRSLREQAARGIEVSVGPDGKKKITSGIVPGPAFRDLIIPIDTANAIKNSAGNPDTIKFLEIPKQINDVARLTMTTFDFGAGMIQGLPLLFTRPAAWVRSQKASLDALRDPAAFSRYVDQHRTTLSEMARHGGSINFNEFTEALQKGAVGDRFLESRIIPKTGEIRKVAKSAANRFADAFQQFGVAARVEMYEAMRPMALRAARQRGLPEEKALAQLTEHVMKMTGVSGQASLGINATRASAERTLLFAPRYLRATVGATADVFQGGLRGELARRTMGKMLAGGVLMHSAIAHAFGQEPNLDPSDSKFLTVNIGGQNVGFGGAWTSMFKLTAQTTEQLLQQFGPLDEDNQRDDIISVDPRDSVLARFARYKSSPIMGLGWDVALGRDPIGREIATPLDKPLEFTGETLVNVSPFWLQSILEDDMPGTPDQSGADKAGQLAAEILGGRAFPSTVFNRRSQLRDEIANNSYGKPWDTLSGIEKTSVTARSEELKTLDIQIREYNLETAGDLDDLTADYLLIKKQIADERHSGISRLTNEWKTGDLNGKTWRDGISAIGKRARVQYETTDENSLYKPAIDQLKLWRARDEDGNRPLEDVLFDEYRDLVIIGMDWPNPKTGQSKMINEFTGEIDHEERKAREEYLRNQFGEEAFERMKVRMQVGTGDDPTFNMYREGQEMFRGYFEVGSAIAEEQGIEQQWKDYKRLEGSYLADEMKIQTPEIVEVESLLRKVRQSMRDQSPALDAWLLKFQYTEQPRNATVKALGKKLIQQMDASGGFDALSLPLD
jgi:hypothetical protein